MRKGGEGRVKKIRKEERWKLRKGGEDDEDDTDENVKEKVEGKKIDGEEERRGGKGTSGGDDGFNFYLPPL